MHRMSLRAVLVRLLVVVILFSGVSRVQAQSSFNIGPTAGQAAGALVAVGVVIGVGVYFIARAPRTTGCVVREGGGLALEDSKSGDPGYLLEGKTDSLHEGERVKVIGWRREGAAQRKVLRVKGVAKNYGPCPAVASTAKSAGAP